MSEERFLIPAEGTLERIFFNALLNAEEGSGVTYLDLVGTGITEDNIDQIAQNLRNGIFVAENDGDLRVDA
jgi:hypothetical protein